MNRVRKESFSVIGKEGTTLDGAGFVRKLWNDANGHFSEVQHLAKKNDNGELVGIWGVMSDLTRSFNPWENDFSTGLYLAGVECIDDARAPEGWKKWTIPGYEYLRAECQDDNTFAQVMEYMNRNGIPLVGAVHDFTCPQTGRNYMLFPVKKL